jgi:hypothetical protein
MGSLGYVSHFTYQVVIATLTFAASCYGQGRDLGTRIPSTQLATSGAESALSELLIKNLGKPANPHENTWVKGSPYFDEQFLEGIVYYNGHAVDTVLLRYNAYQDEIQVKRTPDLADPVEALLKNSAITCVLGQNRIAYKDFLNDKDQVQTSYFFTLLEGKKYGLYSRLRKIIRAGRKSSNSLARSIDAQFIDKTEYYVLTSQSLALRQLPRRKAKIPEFFQDDDRNLVVASLKKFRFNSSNQDLMVHLFRRLNEN